MGKGEKTRAVIVDEALSQAVLVGLDGLSLGTLARSLGLSKSGLYAHFKSKEALQLAVLEAAIERFKTYVIAPGLAFAPGSARLRTLFVRYLNWIEGKHSAGGCPFTVFAQEFDDKPGAVRELLAALQQEWRALLARSVEEAVGNAPPERSPSQTAFEIVGIALSYQMATRLLGDVSARQRAMSAFDRLIGHRQGR
jgi:AcrR family transcriptional regulator